MFENHKKLQFIELPETIESIGANAFKGCTNLQKIDIPDSVTSLGSRLFANAKGIKEFTVPAQITEGKDLFNGSSLESVSFEDAVRNAISLGGDSDTIAAITGSIAEAAYGIPDHIKKKAYFIGV